MENKVFDDFVKNPQNLTEIVRNFCALNRKLKSELDQELNQMETGICEALKNLGKFTYKDYTRRIYCNLRNHLITLEDRRSEIEEEMEELAKNLFDWKEDFN